MPNLCDSMQHRQFVKMLTHCKKLTFQLDEWEEQFIADIAARYDERETQADLGLTQWQPTLKQWNALHSIYHRTT